jgi:dolichyl-phosphate-mannose-protein mannosyltransferase
VIALALLFSVCMPVLIGGLLIRRLWTDDSRPLTVELCLSPVLGLGICSIEFFLWVAIFGRASTRVGVVEIATVITLIAWSLFARRGQQWQTPPVASTVPTEDNIWIRGFCACFLLAAAAGVIAFVCLSAKSPEGGFDAWDHFAIKARFLFLGGDQWKRAFLSGLNDYADYPLMLPTTLARFWQYLGDETSLVQVFVAMLFTFGTVALLVASLSSLRGKQQGLLAGLVLLGTPFFITHGAIQYADVPLGFLFLATLVLLTEARYETRDLGAVVLAGIFASIAAWTKNEGLVFTLLVLVVQGFVVFVREGPRECRRQSLAFATGALPILIVLTWFKLHLAPSNILVAQQADMGDIVHRFSSPSRYIETGKAFIDALVLTPGFGKWTVNLIPLMVLYGAVAGSEAHAKRTTAVTINALVVGVIAVTYFAIFVDLRDLRYYLLYGLDRLLLQLWPSAVFVFFLLIRSPYATARQPEKLQSAGPA